MPIIVSDPLPVGTGLHLCEVWFNNADDLADVMAYEHAGDSINITSSVRVEVRANANRRRLIRRETKVYESFSLTLLECTAEQRLWLRDHIGMLLCIRDHIGSKVYGVYTELPQEVSTLPIDDDLMLTDVKITFEEIDHSEAVV